MPSPLAGSRAAVRWLGLVGCSGVLLVLGQFQEQVFAGLARGWQRLNDLLGQPRPPGLASGPASLSQHSLPLALAYHSLYAGASIALLHLLLRGRGTGRVVVGFGGTLVLGTALLAGSRAAHWPALADPAHLLLDFASSPAALLGGYALATLGSTSVSTSS